ncbi:hypothetical protein LTR36_004110 [Oleoguttula mirabilis]|uniref:Uncharacterized protein n=1 Tax=Oleoguttula mirabilis TaxID=1507867 RepID=A0AAV9JJ63_9PEZI|nr:hypothetical protein LTR36_004110 [Oleoguttula mirabilis]
MPTTEIIALHPLASSDNDREPQGKAANGTDGTVGDLSESDGLQSCYYGLRVEHPHTLDALITWNDAYAHDMSHLAYLVAKHYPSTLFSKHHVEFEPFSEYARAVAAPVTEVATLYYDGLPPADCMDGLREMRQVFVDHQISGWLALAAGLTHEDVEYEGVEGKAAVLVIGWQSTEHHLAWRATQLYADTLHLWPRGAKKLEMHHTAFRPGNNILGGSTLHVPIGG